MKKVVNFSIKVVVIIILILLICYIRNIIVLNQLASKASKNITIDNYYVKRISYENEHTAVTQVYNKNEKRVEIVDYYKYSKEILSKTTYTDGKENIIIIEQKGDKYAKIDQKVPNKVFIYNVFENKNLFSLAFQNIISEKVNQKECYVFEIDNVKYFVEKDTGLVIRLIINENISQIIDNYYELENVNDENVQKPDITGYQIIQ